MLIAAAPEVVGAVLHDADAAPLWTHGLEKLELIEGEVGAPGSVGLAHYVEGGRRYTLRDRLLSVIPNRHYVSEISGSGIRAVVETTLIPVADGTQMTIQWSGSGTNPITKITLPFMRGRIYRQAVSDLEALRNLVESGGEDNRS